MHAGFHRFPWAAWLLATVFSTPAWAGTFVVSTVADAGSGSLRQAILDANAMTMTDGVPCAPHVIAFAIPGDGPHAIKPSMALPAFEIGITVDGYSQPGASPNTLDIGNDAVLRIELDGSLAGPSHAIVVQRGASCSGSGSIITGLAINRWSGAAILVQGDPVVPEAVGGVRILGNFIGTDVTGNVALGNGAGLGSAAIVFGTHTVGNLVGEAIVGEGGPTIPSPSSRNVISGNAHDGVRLTSQDAAYPARLHRIRNAWIGTNASGTEALPNGGHGIVVATGGDHARIHDSIVSGNAGDGVHIATQDAGSTGLLNCLIGVGAGAVPLGNQGHGVAVSGTALAGEVSLAGTGAAARIAHNGGAGVSVAGETRVQVTGASFAHNGGLGIDLAPAGVNPNDPQDGDLGPNEGLNHPLIDEAGYDATTQHGTLGGTLDTVPNASVELHFYLNEACDPSGAGEGQALLLDPFPVVVQVVTDPQGHATFHRDLAFGPPPGTFLTAFSRMRGEPPEPGVPGPFVVSEFSPCRMVGGELPDPVFNDGFEVP